MHNFFDTLVQVLSADKRFFSENGILLRNKVYECAMRMDAGLLGLLLGNDETKKRFFTEVAGALVFDKVGFGWVINNRQFLPDSYTRFKNRIGLTDGHGNLISASEDVVLAFPYKDCVLEGGQTKEDQKRDEIFYNETLAPDEIDRLLYPKALVNATKFQFSGECDLTGRPVNDGNGEASSSHVSQFEENDNLIIRGNNLLALSSLLKRYEGRVKCIYIDPPYNTGDDDFKLREVQVRQNQYVFRKMILTIYGGRCCLTGLSMQEVLRASHISAWAFDVKNRMNPENGLCLSATYDAAFDRHLISFDEDYRLIIAPCAKEHYTDDAFKEHFVKFEGRKIAMPVKFLPSQDLLSMHREHLAG